MATSNKDMGTMLRMRRAAMAAPPDDSAYAGPPSPSSEPANDSDTATESTEKFTVAAPGDPATGDQFEYEPFTDIAGAWVVYPPGVPCDNTEYRIQMKNPAGSDDFAEMQKALDDAGATSPEPSGASSSDVGLSGGGSTDSTSYAGGS